MSNPNDHKRKDLLIGILLFMSLVLASCSNNEAKVSEAVLNEVENIPVFTEASVHDPSVIKVEDTFYVFGSHLAAAKSTDLMNWKLIASGVNSSNQLFQNVKEELKETFDWAESDTLWAADVIQLEDGKFYMYYNACKGDSPRSAMGVAVADKVNGPYKNKGIILKSGMKGEPSEDGTVYNALVHPNVVDPDVFYDKDNNLWMVYGSYSGGIFILQMDPGTGMPLPDQGYGKHLTGGNHSRIEGPYMLYSPVTNFYYLFVSFGGLDANGAYNMRVARSENPDGPFYDAENYDMVEVKADPSVPLFDDLSIEPYGVKLMGNYLFNSLNDDFGSETTGMGYISPGHNSAYYDSDTGKYFLIFHTRFPDRGEKHEIRVHEMYMNSQGWPVVAPYRYAADTQEQKIFDPKDIIGDYKFINHGKDITADIKESTSITLKKKGKISGDVRGTWKSTSDVGVQIIIDDVTYDGIFSRQWDSAASKDVLTFSAVSQTGVSIWGSQVLD